MVYGDFKDLPRTTGSDNILRDKTINIAKNPKYDGYQRGLPSVVYKVFDKKFSGSGAKTSSEIMTNQQLAEELHKPIIRKVNNIWGADLADMQIISKSDKGIHFLLCVIDIFSKYA